MSYRTIAPRNPVPSQEDFLLKDLEGPVETFSPGATVRSSSKVQLRNVKPVSSYLWVEARTEHLCTIAALGYPRIWRKTTVTTVPADSDVHYIYCLFRTNVDLLGKTCLFTHRDEILAETIKELHEFGHQYEVATTKPRRGAEEQFHYFTMRYVTKPHERGRSASCEGGMKQFSVTAMEAARSTREAGAGTSISLEGMVTGAKRTE
ncbi:hypothetical protein EDC04DRAFT_3089665 [Pisolithus marmoratus]|nr:hypothetical protein EDC04DRAFT_3089665 [Pisolithus marmoratus]